MLPLDTASLVQLQLPSYNSIFPPPTYSSDPVCGEQSIQLTRRTRPRPAGTFAQRFGSITVLLTDQEEGVSIPVYGRQSAVKGIINLDLPEAAREVKVKLHGHMDLVISGGTSQNTILADYVYTVWRHNPDTSDQGSATCPSKLHFTCMFPSTFKDSMGREYPLPPSMQAAYPGSSGLYANCTYRLTVNIVKRGFFAQVKKLVVPLHYYPRTRPLMFMNSNTTLDLFSDVKISPEEWYQTMIVVQSREPTVTPPVQCSLFIPSIKVFALSDAIHFHVQITGPLFSLRQLVYSKLYKSTGSPHASAKLAPKIRVYLMRQIVVNLGGQRGWKNITLGEGIVSPRPPPIVNSSIPAFDGQPVEDSLDWEGKVRCDEDVTCGTPGFITRHLTVQDFLVLSVSPADPTKSNLMSTQVPVAIKLVTNRAEAWRED